MTNEKKQNNTAAMGFLAVWGILALGPRMALPLEHQWLEAPLRAQFYVTLWRIAVAALILCGAAGWGGVLRRWLATRLDKSDLPANLEDGTILVDLATGLALLALTELTLAATGLLNPAAHGAVGLALLMGAWRFLTNNDLKYIFSIQRIKKLSLAEVLAAAAILWLAASRAIEALAPPYSWDAQTYHLAVPMQYLASGGFHLIPLNIYSNMPMNMNMLYLAGIGLGDPIVPKILHFSLGLGAAAGLVQAGRRLHLPEAGWLAALFFLGAPSVFYQWGAAFIDVGMAFFTVCLLNLALGWLENPDRRTPLALGAIAAGFIIGSKYTGLYVPVALIGAIVLVGGGPARRMILSTKAFVLLVLYVALFVVPWLIKSAILTGNPVYPLLFDWFGGRYWTPRMADWLIDWQRNIGMGRTALDHLALPWRVAVEAGGDYGHFAGRLMGLPMALTVLVPLFWGNRRLRVVWVWFWLGFSMWEFGAQQIRFLIPLYPLLCLSSAMALGALGIWARKKLSGAVRWNWKDDGNQRNGKRRSERLDPAMAGIVGAVALMAILGAGRPVAGTIDPKGALRYVAMQETAREFLRPRVRSFEAFEWLETEMKAGRIKPDERVVMLFENMGLYCPLPYFADGMFEASVLADLAHEAGSAEAFARRIEKEIDPEFILVNGNILRDIEAGRNPAPGQRRTFADDELHEAYFRTIDIQTQYIQEYCEAIFISDMNSTIYIPKSKLRN